MANLCAAQTRQKLQKHFGSPAIFTENSFRSVALRHRLSQALPFSKNVDYFGFFIMFNVQTYSSHMTLRNTQGYVSNAP